MNESDSPSTNVPRSPRRFRFLSPRTPLAWKNLIHAPRRLLLAAAGVGFASVLMFTQNGFRNALLDSPVQLITLMDCELVAISPARYMLPVNQRFPRDLLRRAQADPDVVACQPMYIERLLARVRVAGNPSRTIRVISVPPLHHHPNPGPIELGRPAEGSFAGQTTSTKSRDWLQIPGLAQAKRSLVSLSTALIDRKTRHEYGFRFDEAGQPIEQVVELANKRIRLVGTVEVGTDFANEGTLLIREEAFATYFPIRGNGEPLETVDIGMVRLRDGVDADQVAQRLTELAPGRWEVMTRQALIDREQTFWSTQTPVGSIFFVGTLMGFAVGVIICYQILYTSLQDAMPEFATLKAMGYPNRYFVGLVVRQAIYLSVLGFIPAVMLTLISFRLLEAFSGLPMFLTPQRAGVVLGLTTLMCLVSGLLALRKLLRADPASLF